MTALFEPSPLGGVLGAHTCSIFRLDPFGIVPLEPLLDLVPGITPMRVTLDMIDSETIVHDYSLTTHPIQDIGDATSNVHENLKKLTIEGTCSANLAINIVPLPIEALPNPFGLLRLDLIKLRNLQNMAHDRVPVMVVTPRYAMAKAWIGQIRRTWTPDDGTQSKVVIEFTECKIVSPSVGPPIKADYSAQLPGNNAAVGGGQASTSAASSAAPASGTPGVPPAL